MKELAVRTIFAFLLLIFYIVGSYLNPLFKAHFTDLNIAPLLPLLTIVYLPYLIRYISPHLATFTLAAKPLFTQQRLTLPLRIHFGGTTPQVLRIEEVIAPAETNVFLQHAKNSNKSDDLPVPEGIHFSIGPQQPVTEFQLIIDFRSPPDPHPPAFPRCIWTRTQSLRVVLRARIGTVRHCKTWYIPIEASS